MYIIGKQGRCFKSFSKYVMKKQAPEKVLKKFFLEEYNAEASTLKKIKFYSKYKLRKLAP